MYKFIFWLLFIIVFYIYVGYPLLLDLFARFTKRRSEGDARYLPNLSFVISAFNEEEVIIEKLMNTSKLDYPEDKLFIWVVSDASSDQTDDLVKSFKKADVHLLRVEGRRGKTHGISEVMGKIDSDVVVFSDANAIYQRDALRQLVKHFKDPQVGYVVGQAKYYQDEISAAGANENAYWSFELRLKKNESAIGSVVGGDGAIYAIRRSLFIPLDDEDINDFVNPIQIILQGYRGVFEADAVCYEQTGDSFEQEFKRKRRIVNRSWRGLWKNAVVMNPFRTGTFAWQIISHKLLRWLGGLFGGGLFVTNLFILQEGIIYNLLLSAQSLFYLFVLMGYYMHKNREELPSLVGIPFYFFMVNYYSLLGIWDAFRGETYTTWQTIRENNPEKE